MVIYFRMKHYVLCLSCPWRYGHILYGAVHKDVRRQAEGGLSNANILRSNGIGVLQIRTSALLVQKTSDFSKFMVYPHGQGGEEVEPGWTFYNTILKQYIYSLSALLYLSGILYIVE